ncbi:MAG: helix-turn-helix transcriptional regulator [Nocardioides sp.]|nr:helix-turn-helix transcriptional regulator [Nocardioides sp.]
MRKTSLADLPCPIARSLDIVGEWWTLLIVRDALFGSRRYEEFKRIGMGDNILATRLRRLVDAQILCRSRYQRRPDRYEYLLTARGRALMPVIGALRQWGREWTEGNDLSPTVIHDACGHEPHVEVRCSDCDREVTMAELRPIPAQGG